MYDILGLINVFSTFQETVWSHLKHLFSTLIFNTIHELFCNLIGSFTNRLSAYTRRVKRIKMAARVCLTDETGYFSKRSVRIA